jgi:hypothetical protein
MEFPTQALNPNGDKVSILVDANGRVVTDQSPKPTTTYPATERSIRVDAAGNLLVT